MNPCQVCGACCAAFRVSFYRGEAIAGPSSVPEELVTPIGPFRDAMRGTEVHPPRCVALAGTVGQETACSIYALRPSPCREFAAAWQDGAPEPRCDEARARHGLPPLRPEDWHADRDDPSRRPPGRPGRRRRAA